MMEELNSMFGIWKTYYELKLIPKITVEFGMLIYSEMERCESFEVVRSPGDPAYERYAFMIDLYKEVHKRYPVTMERARIAYFGTK